MMRVTLASLALMSLLVSAPAAQKPAAKTLDIYITDTEGGKATLFVSPTGQSALLDTGNANQRDLDRILAVIKEAGLEQLDYMITTHYHGDHVGSMTELAKQIPIAHYVDHGPTIEEREHIKGFQAAYAELYGKAKHTVVKPGDRVPITGFEWHVVTSAGKAIAKPFPGAGKPNPYCAEFKPKEVTYDPENGQSLGSLIVLGKFRAIDLGDLLWNNEFDLMCPNNPIGAIDLYLTSHHGTDISGSATLVHALQPRVAITQNGTRKGATLQTSQILNSSPGLEDIWQLHWSYNGGIEHNPPGLFIANVDDISVIASILNPPPPPPPATGDAAGGRQGGRGGPGQPHTGPAFWIKVSAQPDGTFTVTNTRNGFSRTYRAR